MQKANAFNMQIVGLCQQRSYACKVALNALMHELQYILVVDIVEVRLS